MTNREFYAEVIATTTNEEVRAHAEEALAKLDERNAKRAMMPSKKSIENEPIKDAIVAFIGSRNEQCIASAIAEAVGISTQKATALCRQLVADEVLTVGEVKVPKKGTQKAYALA